jgi:hypothetical protein
VYRIAPSGQNFQLRSITSDFWGKSLTATIRPWVRWTVALVWIATAVAVAILVFTHTSATATAIVHVREIKLKTDPGTFLDPMDQDRFTVSGSSELNISSVASHGAMGTINAHTHFASSSCTFYHVRTSPLKLATETDMTLMWPQRADPNSFSIRLSAPVSGTLAPLTRNALAASFGCTDIEPRAIANSFLDGTLSNRFDTSFITNNISQLSFKKALNAQVHQTQLRVAGPIAIVDVNPGQTPEETSVLLPPIADKKNVIIFDDASKTIQLNVTDLVLIKPGTDFYIHSLDVDNGLQIEFHGTAKDVLIGAGPNNYKSRMPSLFDKLDNSKRFFAVIPGSVAFILGLLEAIGLLPKRR